MAPPRGAVPAVIAVVVFAAFVTAVLLAFTTDDGADSPEQAVLDLVAALEAADAVAALDTLPAWEQPALTDGFSAADESLRSAGLVTDVDPRAVPGIDLAADGLELRSTPLSTTVSAVDVVGGTLTGSIGGTDDPLTARFRAVLADAGVDVGDGEQVDRDFGADPLRLVTVREGGWHVSLGYTVAEAVRLDDDRPLPRFGEGPDAIGADNPGAVVDDLVRAYAAGDVTRMVTLQAPEEGRVVYDYAPGFLDPASRHGRLVDALGRNVTTVNDIQVEATGDGPEREVTVTALDLDLRAGVRKTHVVIEDGCTRVDERFFDDDPPHARWDSCGDAAGGAAATTRPIVDPLTAALVTDAGAGGPTFVVLERNGRWFLNPLSTVERTLVAALSDDAAIGARLVAPTVRDALAVAGLTDSDPDPEPDDPAGQCAWLAPRRAGDPGAATELEARCLAYAIDRGWLPPPE